MTEGIKRGVFWLAVIVAACLFLYLIRAILLPFVLGIFIAYFLDPAADRLERMGLSRTLATLSIIGCFFLLIVALSILVMPMLASQLSAFLAALPGYINGAERRLTPLVTRWVGELPMVNEESLRAAVGDMSGFVARIAGDFIAGIFHSGMAFVNLLSLILITPVVAFYLLEDWDSVVARIDALLPRAHASVIREQLAVIDRTLAGFVRGQINVMAILCAYYGLLLSAAGLHFSIVIGVATGLLVIVPYAGWLLGASVGMGVAFFQFGGSGSLAAVAAIFLAGAILEGNFLTPRLVGRQVGLHPVWVIFGMLAGAALFGFVGILLSLPATAVIGVLLRFATQRYLQSEYYRGEPTG